MRMRWSLLVPAVAVVAVVVGVSGCPKDKGGAADTNAMLPTMQNAIEPAPTTGLPPEGENAIVPGPPGGPGEAPGAPGQPNAPGAVKGGAPKSTGVPDLDALLKKRAALKSYKMVATSKGKTVSTRVVQQSDGRPVRTKMSIGDTGDWMLMLNDKNEHYRYSAKEKVIMKLPSFGSRGQGGPGGPGGEAGAKGGEGQKGERPQGPPPGAEGQSKGGERGGMAGRMRGGFDLDMRELASSKPTVKSETLNGVACLRVDVKRQDGATASYWLDTQYGLVRQSKVGDAVMTMKYEEINSVPDSAFALPQGVKVVDAPAGMGFGGPGGGRSRNGGQSGQAKSSK
jgi:hypothetical protein